MVAGTQRGLFVLEEGSRLRKRFGVEQGLDPEGCEAVALRGPDLLVTSGGQLLRTDRPQLAEDEEDEAPEPGQTVIREPSAIRV